jgi:hypothetical protein
LTCSSAAEEQNIVTRSVGHELYNHRDLIAGREDITREVLQDCLSGKSRILTGIGGIGKSTVAMAILRDPAVQARFGDRSFPVLCHEIVLLDKTRVGIQLHLAKAILQSMRVSETPPRRSEDSPTAQLSTSFNHIRARAENGPTLLLLDNLESLTQYARNGVEDFLSALAAMPNMVCLGTSRDNAVHPDDTASKELPPLNLEHSLAIFKNRLRDSMDPEHIEFFRAMIEKMDGHPLCIVLLAAYARINFVSAATLARWPRYGARILSNGDISDRHGSLAATVELSLDSLDPAQDSPTRALLLLLSSHPKGFPAVPERTVMAFSTEDPDAIRKLLGLSLVYTKKEPDMIDSRTYHVLRPIAQYMLERYKALSSQQEAAWCRGYLAVFGCLGSSPKLPVWVHDWTSAGHRLDHHDTQPLATLSRCPGGICSTPEERAQDPSGSKACDLLQRQIVQAVLVTGPKCLQHHQLTIQSLGQAAMNLALWDRAGHDGNFGKPSQYPGQLFELLCDLDSHAHV